jgi:glycine/D-amino acid oxidase-like deaminating enzyme
MGNLTAKTGPAARSLAEVKPVSFWLDSPDAPEPLPALTERVTADLAVVGGGFTGLWTALLAKERDPQADVVLLEGKTIGHAASGRNGGFCSASLTHGFSNGLERFGAEMPALERMGDENLAGIADTITRYAIDCDFQPTGELSVATAGWQLDGAPDEVAAARALGYEADLLDADGIRAELDSPALVGGIRTTNRNAMVNPARLAWGLRRACLEQGVRVYENCPVRSVSSEARPGLTLTAAYGEVRAARVALGTGAFTPALLRRVGHWVVPVWDYVLMTEPLTAQQLASIGWTHRRGASDRGNQFHYFRLTADNRVLWGGYDAVYYNGGRRGDDHATSPATFLKLAEHFNAMFPQLQGVRFSHAWGGVIDTCSRFSAFFGTAHRGRLGYAAGYTGLGVGATRFGAQVILDLLSGQETTRTALSMVRSKPVPFPPEPLRSVVIQATRASIARADRNEGRRDLWLRTLDRLGLGFDSLPPAIGGDVVEEGDRGGGAGAPPGHQDGLEAVGRAVAAERPCDRLQGSPLPPDEAAGVAAPAVQQRQLQQQVGADVADVLDRRVQPVAHRAGPGGRRGVDGALRSLPRLGALAGDQPGFGEPPDRPVDDRPRDMPDPAQLSVGRGELGHREAVRGLLADHGEHGPFGQPHDSAPHSLGRLRGTAFPRSSASFLGTAVQSRHRRALRLLIGYERSGSASWSGSPGPVPSAVASAPPPPPLSVRSPGPAGPAR